MSENKVQVQITGDSAELQAATAKAEASLKGLESTVNGGNVEMAAAGAASKEAAEGLATVAVETEKLGAGAAVANEAIKKVTTSLHSSHGATSTATNEFRALFDELSSGRTSRSPGTIAIILNRVIGLQGAALLAAGGIGALGFAMVETIVSAERLDEAVGGVIAALDASGRSADATRPQIYGIIDSLRQMPGVSTKAAEQLVADFARQREIGVSSYEALGTAAAGFARVTGDDVPKAGQELAKALEQGYAGILKLDSAYNFLSAPQLEAIRQFDLAGEKGRALDIAIPALAAKFGPLVTEGMTPTQIAAASLADSWDHLLGQLGNTGPVNGAREAISGLIAAWSLYLSGNRDVDQASPLADMKQQLADAQGLREQLEKDGYSTAGEDARIAKIKELIAEREKASAPTGTSPNNGETDSNAEIKQALELEHSLGLEAQRREELEARIAEFKRAATDAGAQETKARAAGDGKGADAYAAERQRLVADTTELQAQLDQIHGKGQQSRLQGWQDTLDRQLIAQGKFKEDATRAELDFWNARLLETDKGSTDELEVERRIWSLKSQLNQDGIADARKKTEAEKQETADEWANFSTTQRDKIELAKGNFAEQIRLAQEWVDKGRDLYGDDIKNYRDAILEKTRLTREKSDEALRVEQIRTEGEAERAKSRTRGDAKLKETYNFDDLLNNTPNKDLAAAQANLKGDFETEQGADTKARDNAPDAVARENINQRILKAQQEFTTQSDALNKQAADKVKAVWESALSPIDHAFSQSINGMIQGTETLRQGVARAGQAIALAFIDAAEHGLVKWIAGELAKLTVTETTQVAMTGAVGAGTTARATIETAGAELGKATQTATAHTSILTDAKQAASGAYAAVAGIPYIGPFLAPAAAATAFAGVLAFDVASAAGGWGDVPFDDMPTLLHKNEMVLPANLANPLRDQLSGSASGSGSMAFHYAPSLTGSGPMGRAEAEQFFRSHGDLMIRHLANAVRNGKLKTA